LFRPKSFFSASSAGLSFRPWSAHPELSFLPPNAFSSARRRASTYFLLCSRARFFSCSMSSFFSSSAFALASASVSRLVFAGAAGTAGATAGGGRVFGRRRRGRRFARRLFERFAQRFLRLFLLLGCEWLLGARQAHAKRGDAIHRHGRRNLMGQQDY